MSKHFGTLEVGDSIEMKVGPSGAKGHSCYAFEPSISTHMQNEGGVRFEPKANYFDSW